MKTAIIVIDVINDFVIGVLKTERAQRIIPNIQCLLEFARKKKIPIVYTNDAHLSGVDKELEVWPAHALAGTRGAQVIDELKPLEGDYVIQKRRYSSFHGTGLDQLLRDLKADTLVLVGLVTNICIQHTAADAFFRGYRIFVPEDGVEAPTEKDQKTSLEYMRKMYGCKITTVKELIEKKLS